MDDIGLEITKDACREIAKKCIDLWSDLRNSNEAARTELFIYYLARYTRLRAPMWGIGKIWGDELKSTRCAERERLPLESRSPPISPD